jgi:hypothetical protein
MRFARDALCFAFCWFCFIAYTRGPWSIMRGEFGFRVLPYAGMYAYSDTWADFRECVQWNADGRPRRG